ncbi:MAG: hypothetical protein Q9O74_10380 [Planctomycetota bacterium]|nr:hypothetical protein [Planctomycetota bacterium]
MPPLQRILTLALAEMVDELRFASREALLRDIDRAEALAGEIDPGVGYPADWVVFRVTGYRPEMTDPPVITGDDLLGDLSAVVERLCETARLTAADIAGPVEPLDELAARWSVSVKTLSRWRRRGLIARRVHDERGGVRLVFTEEATAAYEARNAGGLERAAGFSRIDEATSAQIIRRARRYHDLLGMNLTQCAERLAARFDRSREAVRMLLVRHDTAARTGRNKGKSGRADAGPIFDPSRALGERTHRVIERAWRRGIEPALMTKRYRRSRAGIHRIINEQRLARLRGLEIGHVAPEAAALDEDEIAALLGEEVVRVVEPAVVPGDMTELLEMMRERVVPVGVEERLQSKAEHVLRGRALRLMAAVGSAFPEAGLIDRAETDLRWAAGLRSALSRTQLLLMLETVASSAGIDFAHVRSQDARALVEAGLGGLRGGLDGFDPWKAGRLAGTVGLAVARVRVDAAPGGGAAGKRARVRILAGTPAPDWTLLVSPWVERLRPDRRAAGVRGALEPELREVLSARFGFDGTRPQTLAEIAAARGLTIMQAGRLERRAIRGALEAARGGGGDGGGRGRIGA